jgi:uncharacterized protein YydD (DUF2326 family)
MFLKSLTVHNGEQLIRSIPFHRGINLIVDNTPLVNLKTNSGNSVGKTTVLRLIDFCLDGSDKNITTDPEFKTKNKVVESFLKNNDIIITLTLADDLSSSTPKTIEIKRNFLSRNKKIQSINGEKKSKDDFSKTLKSLIFRTDSEKPTFRQLKSKNIRDEKNKLIHTIRVLSPFDTDVAYETLHLFWFGIDIDLSKDKFVREKNLEEKLQKRMRKTSNLPQIKQALIIIDKQIKELSKQKENFNLNEKYEHDLQLLNSVKRKINFSSGTISRLEVRKELIEESKRDLESDISNVNLEGIKELYKRAKTLIPSIQKTFEETVTFHNGMINEKINFITEELPELTVSIDNHKHDLTNLLKEESGLSEKLKKTGAIENLQSIIDRLNSFHEKKGSLEEQKRSWESSNSNLENAADKISQINTETYSKDDAIQEKIAEFNEHFSSISSRLDGIHSLLSAETVDGIYKFVVTNIESNPGTGTKKSQMASFDLAYIKFADSSDIPCLHFILQDQIENVHSNQITNLFTELVSEVNCQYVLPVLRDKLPSNLNIADLEVLSLTQDDKFFRI